MSVLVDTSVWIRFLSNRAPYAAGLDALLERDEVAGHELVFGELLLGDSGARGTLLAQYEHLDLAPMVPHQDVVGFVRSRRLNGRGIGWIDAHLLASALVGGLRLWTADAALAIVAKECRLAYDYASMSRSIAANSALTRSLSRRTLRAASR